MNIRSFAPICIALATALLSAGPAQAVTYVTRITGTNLASFEISRIELVWSTSVSMGDPVDTADLSDLSISFYDDSDALVYTDLAISGGAAQPVGGVSRTLSAISFTALSGVSISAFDNDLNQVQFGTSIGATYNFYGETSGSINVASYLNGVLQEDGTFNVTGQNTSAIPESSTYVALAGLLGLGLAAARRKRPDHVPAFL